MLRPPGGRLLPTRFLFRRHVKAYIASTLVLIALEIPTTGNWWNFWIMVPWFREVINDDLYSVGALPHVFDLEGYGLDKAQKFKIKQAAQVEERDGKWRVVKKGKLTCSPG